MSILTEYEWRLLNEITYKIHAVGNSRSMRQQFLELLKMITPYTYSTFYLSSGDQCHGLTDPVTVNIPLYKLKEYDECSEIDYTRWIFLSGKNMAYRETDLFTKPERENSKFYNEFYAKHDIHFSIQLSLAFHDIFLGIVSLYRPRRDEDFTEKDVFILDQIKEHLALRLYKDWAASTSNPAGNGELLSEVQTKTEYSSLTRREMEILSLVVNGQSNEDIAEKLFISGHTVKKHLISIYKKLSVKNRMQLLKYRISPATVWQKR